MGRKKLDQAAAILILNAMGDMLGDDPAWEDAVSAGIGEPDYPEDCDDEEALQAYESECEKLPTFADVLLAAGIPLAAINEALKDKGGAGEVTDFSKGFREPVAS
jgi:hypothetical protein